MAEHAVSDELVELWSDRKWRLNNLYYIENKQSEVVLFQLNESQEKLLEDMHYLNIILKARQMGFSTFILLLALDCAIFNSHFDAGLIADTLDNAKGLLARIKFAYERLDEDIKNTVSVVADNAQEIQFSNGSSIEVGVSLRSSTKNFLHISEYGKICAKQPDKAKEIKSGALNTMAQGQLGFIESTAEGASGDFYDKSMKAKGIIDRDPFDMEWKFHFFPWWEDKNYSSSADIDLTAEQRKYFSELEQEIGKQLSQEQKAWYVLKSEEQGDDMWKEYPSTPDEAFKVSIEGSYYGKHIANAENEGRVSEYPYNPKLPLYTAWDIGVDDYTAVWFVQDDGKKAYVVDYYEASGDGAQQVVEACMPELIPSHEQKQLALDNLDRLVPFKYTKHYLPHDVKVREWGGGARTREETLMGLGVKPIAIGAAQGPGERINALRRLFPLLHFHNSERVLHGLNRLRLYSRKFNKALQVYGEPKHDENSHGADALGEFAVNSPLTPKPKVPEEAKKDRYRTKLRRSSEESNNWKTA